MFDAADASHAAFVQAAAILKAQVSAAGSWLQQQPASVKNHPLITHPLITHPLITPPPSSPSPPQVYGLTVPEWAADAQRVVGVAAAVPVGPFVPREGVKIETGGWVGCSGGRAASAVWLAGCPPGWCLAGCPPGWLASWLVASWL